MYEKAVTEVFLTLKELEHVIKKIWPNDKTADLFAKHIVVLTDYAAKLVKLAVVVEDAKAFYAGASRVAATATSGLTIAGVVFSAVLLPIDMIFFGMSLKALANNEKSQQAEQIRYWLEEDLPDNDEVIEATEKMNTLLLESVDKLLTMPESSDKIKKIEKSSKKFAQTLRDVLYLDEP